MRLYKIKMQQAGFSDNLLYDVDAIKYQQQKQISPFLYVTDEVYFHHENTCQPYGGSAPRGQKQCIGNPFGCEVGHQQRLIDLDSKLSSRNTILAKTSDGGYNDFDIHKIQMKNLNRCDNFMNPISTKMSMPASQLRGYAINTFVDPLIDKQKHIYWNQARDTKQEAKDNFKPKQQFDINVFYQKSVDQMNNDKPKFNYNVNKCHGLLC